ncbi:phosphate ABC transporter permease subunit PstC [Xanthocytophaga flava]|uniref:phosphate ABC transporter permease subunit PstC n=1 Tax=Xanthocytophaga flava TaxID=3048013 RepID=UPI0028D2EBEA|nr:phosphate ABC transporter permease subunit PstC [Xanthocytophaga flavus]MDJ1470303.1 phosphate ABC transporter permease subunit PstC [Xanthocytophaga flavus]
MKLTRKITEKGIELFLAVCGALSILTTLGILAILVKDSIDFFGQVSILDFLTDSQWTPLFEQKHFGIRALLSGTVLTTGIALITALPVSLIIAIYLSEYAYSTVRSYLKPCLELLAAVPSVVYGYFALTFVTPLLQKLIPTLSGFNALSAGIVMGIMIIPLIASLSEDALQAVPDTLREGSAALGASRLQTSTRVVFPAAYSGIMVAIILAISRAIGETMIVAIAAGQQPRLTFNPLVPIETVTTYIVQVSKGDTAQGSIEYKTIFAAGLSLFVLTFLLNSLSYWITKRFSEKYE